MAQAKEQFYFEADLQRRNINKSAFGAKKKKRKEKTKCIWLCKEYIYMKNYISPDRNFLAGHDSMWVACSYDQYHSVHLNVSYVVAC